MLAVACSSGSDSTSTGTSQGGGAAIVGSIASESGTGAPYGAGQLRGQQLALDLLGPSSGFSLTMTNVDDTSTNPGGVAAMEQLVQMGAIAVLGPTLSPVAVDADPIAQQAGMPVLGVTNTVLDIGAIGDVVWRISLSEDAMIPQAIAAAQAASSFSSAALLHDQTDGYATGAAAAFRSGAAAQGVSLVADEGFVPGDGSARAALQRASSSGAQALFLAARSSAATELLVDAQELSLTQVRVGGNGFNAPEVLAAAGSAAEGLVVAASWNVGVDNADNRAFVEAYQQRYGAEPDAFAAQGYAGIQVLLAALAASGDASREGVQRGLGMIGATDTVLGSLHFAANEAVYPAAVQVVTNGAFALL